MAALVPDDVGVTARVELSPSTMVFLAFMVGAFMLWHKPKRQKK